MTTTWNPSDHGTDAAFSLSGGNLIASATGSVVFAGVRATTSKSSGKWYFELDSVGMNNSGAAIGLATATRGVNTASGDQFNVVGIQGSNGNFVIAFEGSMGSGVGGKTTRIAIDFGGGLYWMAYDAGLWNDDGSADPATGTNGKSFNGAGGFDAVPPPLFPWAFFDFASGTVTIKPDSGTITHAVPSGFTVWDGGAPPPVNAQAMVLM